MAWDNVITQVNAATAEAVAEPPMDEEAFTAFYQRTARQVWAYLARVSGNATLADDLLQKSYVRFLGAAAPWRHGEVTCPSYLFRIATNLLRDHWRRPQTTPIEDVPEAALPIFSSRDSERIDSKTVLGPALSRLKPRERQLLWLAYAEGCTHREIAAITGLRTPSIRLLLFRARRRMARLLRQQALISGKRA